MDFLFLSLILDIPKYVVTHIMLRDYLLAKRKQSSFSSFISPPTQQPSYMALLR